MAEDCAKRIIVMGMCCSVVCCLLVAWSVIITMLEFGIVWSGIMIVGFGILGALVSALMLPASLTEDI